MTTPLTVHGADVSHHQGTLDLPAAKKAGLQFLWHKATEGVGFVDAEYIGRRAAAARAGIPFGAYHFARPSVGDAAAEAEHFISVAKPRPGDLLPALDLETTEGLTLGQLKTWARNFAAAVERHTGFGTAFYSPWDLGLPLVRWVPRYNRDNRLPAVPWDIWQFSGGAEFPGTPSTFPGLGAVDLNTFNRGVTLERILIPQPKPTKPAKPARKVHPVRVAHLSMQFSDPSPQQRADAAKLFARGYRIITGTEAGGVSDLAQILREEGARAGYAVHVAPGSDAWVAVRKNVMVRDWTAGVENVIASGKSLGSTAGGWNPKGVTWATYTDVAPGTVTVLASHYLTKGKRPGKVGGVDRYELNKQLATRIGDLAREKGKGTAIVIYGGDQNIVDREADTFFDAPLTSMWDELGRWENTGHGNIDVLATYDRDGRVQAESITALDDREVRFNTDHFLVEGVLEITAPKPARK